MNKKKSLFLSNWDIKKIETFTTKVGSGATPKGGKESYKSEGISLIRSQNVYNFRFEYKELAKIDNNQANKLNNVIVNQNDILLNITGASVARCTIVPNSVLPARVNQHVSIIRCNQKIALPSFILYCINSQNYKDHLLMISQTGATREALTKDDIENFKIALPPLTIQKKIAAILSTYDELIENNNRRIALLEKMAEELYREWFVRMRFPGHEKVKFCKGVPEGWEVKRLEEVSEMLIDGDWIETKDQGGNDYRLLQISNIGVNKFIEKGNYRFITQDTFKKLNCAEVLPGDILIARMPEPTGRAWLVTNKPWKMITAVDVAILRSNTDIINIYYLIQYLNSRYHLDLVKTNTSGTTRERISRKVLSNVHIIVPDIKMQNEYGKIVGNIYKQINLFKMKNEKMRINRDMLLPRLICGKLNVESLDIKNPRSIQDE